MAAKKSTTKKTSKTSKAKGKTTATAKKTTTRKPATKKAAIKKPAAKTAAKKTVAKAAAKPKAVKIPKKIADPYTKSQLLTLLSEATEMNKKDVAAMFDVLNQVISGHLRGCGNFTLPGLLKLVVKKKPATPARKGINPFTGEETTFKAKPASKTVKARPLSKLKEMVN